MIDSHPTPEQWKKAFARAAAIAINKDYFSDILAIDLYPYAEWDGEVEYEETMEEIWSEVDKQFEELFGYKYTDLI